ncbi:hypothetical protein RCL1_003466 [Eukaryota sp. TZLM3-RCL]
MNKPSIIASAPWILESQVPNNSLSPDEVHLPQKAAELEKIYQLFFSSRPHENHADLTDEENPVLVSIFSFNYKGSSFYRMVFRSSTGFYSGDLEASNAPRSFFRKLFCMGPTIDSIVTASVPAFNRPNILRLRQLPTTPQLVSSLVEFENETDYNRRCHKIGVLYVPKGAKTESEIYSAQNVSEKFEEFLDFIGNGSRIRLKNFSGYNGGLNITKDLTGKRSVYIKWNNHEIMYHVAPYLPYSSTDKQQIARKRHVGNDNVVVVFLEDQDSAFDPSVLISQQNQVVIVVKVVRRILKEDEPPVKVMRFKKSELVMNRTPKQDNKPSQSNLIVETPGVGLSDDSSRDSPASDNLDSSPVVIDEQKSSEIVDESSKNEVLEEGDHKPVQEIVKETENSEQETEKDCEKQEKQEKIDENLIKTEDSPSVIESKEIEQDDDDEFEEIEVPPTKVWYKLSVARKDSITEFGPPIPSPGTFKRSSRFQRYFLIKLICACYAVSEGPEVGAKLARYRISKIKNIVNSASK